MPRGFEYLLEISEDPVILLEAMCQVVNAQVRFSRCELAGRIVYCQVLLGKSRYQVRDLQKHTEAGKGSDWDTAKSQAARKMLKHFQTMTCVDAA